MKQLFLFFLVINVVPLVAKDFGKRAETYPIEETDLVEWIQQQ